MLILVLFACGSEVTAEITEKEDMNIVQQEIQEDLECIQQKLDCMTLIVEKQPLPKECEKYLVTAR